jgi:hypothetical protein
LVEGAGLALLNTDGNSTVEGCEFKDNIDAINGGGAAVMASGNITVIDNTFTGNEASGGEGGGIFLFNSTSGVPGSVSFINNVLSGNTAASGGGALIRSDKNIGDGTIDIINNSFSGNTAVGEGGGLFFAPSGNPVPMNIYNNIFFGNEATPEQGMDVRFVNNSGPQTFALVSLFNNNWGEFCLNNFAEPADNCDPVASLNSQFGTAVDNLPNVDPLFVNAAAGDLRLQENSPLIDEGSAAAPSLPATDHDGDPRIFGPAPDMGAFEFQPEPTPSPTPPPQDGGGCSLQGNGTPGYFLILFLLLVISSWGVRLRD